MRFVSLITLSILATSCCHNRCEMTRYHEDGRAKPVVLVPQMIDTTSFDAPWSLSDELTSMLADRFRLSGQLFVANNEDFSFSENPFSQNLSWMKREFPNQEFVVFAELVEHEIAPIDKAKKDLPPQEISMNLNIAVRIRVVDLRMAIPKVVLQEMIRDSFFIPKTLLPTNYQLVTWGTEEYETSSMKQAHDAIVNEITSRVTDYILLAKSR